MPTELGGPQGTCQRGLDLASEISHLRDEMIGVRTKVELLYQQLVSLISVNKQVVAENLHLIERLKEHDETYMSGLQDTIKQNTESVHENTRAIEKSSEDHQQVIETLKEILQ